MCKEKDNYFIKNDNESNLKSLYSPKPEHSFWGSIKGKYGVNPLNQHVSKRLFNNISKLAKNGE